MSWDSSKIVAPVDWSDIAIACGYSDPDYVIGYMIVNGPSLNKWAKFKPVRNSEQEYPNQLNSSSSDHSQWTWKTATQIRALGELPWWEGSNGHCGLAFTTFTNLYTGNQPFYSSSFLYKLKDGQLDWTYERPRGISVSPDEWFRAFDFIQYNATAPAPVGGFASSYMVDNNNNLTVYIDTNRGDSTSIQLSDLAINNTYLNTYYIGVLIHYSDSSYAFKATAQVGQGETSIQFEDVPGDWIGHDVTMVPFLSSNSVAQNRDPGAGIYLSAGVYPQTVHITSQSAMFQTEIIALWAGDLHGRITYTVNLINRSSSGYQRVENMRVFLYRRDIIYALDQTEPETFDVTAGQTLPKTGSFRDFTYDSSATYYIKVTSDNNTAVGEQNVDESRD